MNIRHDHNLFAADRYANEQGRLDDRDADKAKAIAFYIARYMPDAVKEAEEIMGEMDRLCVIYPSDPIAVQQRILDVLQAVQWREAERQIMKRDLA